MMKRIVSLSVGLVVGATGAYWTFKGQEKEDIKDEELKFDRPESSISFHTYKSHCLNYDRSKKIPVWVSENLSKEDMTKKEEVANRERSSFQPDPNLPAQFSATNTDYWDSGWSRGHMAAAGNHKHSQESMDHTFYLTNILPQNLDNNSNYWYRLERYCRKLIETYDNVTVISGPLFVPTVVEDGKKIMKYEVLGESNVHVPTHLFKIVLAENKDDSPPLLGSFIIPNEPIPDQPLVNFQVPLETIEKHSGTRFLKRLQLLQVKDLCQEDGCQLMSQAKVDLYRYSQKIRKSQSKSDVESVWTELHSKGYKPDQFLINTYKNKLKEFDE